MLKSKVVTITISANCASMEQNGVDVFGGRGGLELGRKKVRKEERVEWGVDRRMDERKMRYHHL